VLNLYGTATTAAAAAMGEDGALQQSHELLRDNRLSINWTSRRAINPLSQRPNCCST